MKKNTAILLAISVAMGLASGWAGKVQLRATPVKNVENIVVAETQTTLEVYSQTGICRFDLSSTAETTVIITMHYNEEETFRKIEGVTLNGQNDIATVLGPNRFQITIPGDNIPLKIQVIDFYR